jgi:hypothetical protein
MPPPCSEISQNFLNKLYIYTYRSYDWFCAEIIQWTDGHNYEFNFSARKSKTKIFLIPHSIFIQIEAKTLNVYVNFAQNFH